MPLAPPRIPGHWLHGNLNEIRRDPLGFLRYMHQGFGDINVHRLGPLDYHLVAHPDGVKRVLQDNHPAYSKRVGDIETVGYMTGDGVLVTDGADWMRRRRLMQPAFHRERIVEMTRTMEALTHAWLDEWERVPAGQWHNASEAINRLTMRIAAQTLFSLDLDAQGRAVLDSFTACNRLLIRRFRAGRFFAPVFLFADDREFLRERRRMDEVIDAIIRERRAAPGNHHDLLAMLMSARDEDNGSALSDQDLRAEVKTLLLAGFETTSNALAWSLHLTARHPAWADSAASEAAAPLLERPATRALWDETMRLYPPAWYTARRAEREDEICGYRIPRHARIVISPYLLHRHPQFWERPDEFDAARFLPGRRDGAHRFSYFPFGGGPRQCIGNQFALAEGLTALSAFHQRFRIIGAEPAEPTPYPLITLRMREDLRLRVERR